MPLVPRKGPETLTQSSQKHRPFILGLRFQAPWLAPGGPWTVALSVKEPFADSQGQGGPCAFKNWCEPVPGCTTPTHGSRESWWLTLHFSGPSPKTRATVGLVHHAGVELLPERGQELDLGGWNGRKNTHRERSFMKGFLRQPTRSGELTCPQCHTRSEAS